MARHTVIRFGDGSMWISPPLSEADENRMSRIASELWADRKPLVSDTIVAFGTEDTTTLPSLVDLYMRK